MKTLRLTFWAMTAGYWLLIATLTHLPPKYLPHVPLDDKLEHFLAYGGLSAVLGFALWTTFPGRPLLPFLVLVIAMVYGGLDEQTQKLVGRDCDFDDWLADVAGAMAGILPVVISQRLFERRLGLRSASALPAALTPAPILAPELEAALEAYTDGDEAEVPDGPARPARRPGTPSRDAPSRPPG